MPPSDRRTSSGLNRLGSWLVEHFVCGKCEMMHRRAQAAESASAKVLRQNAPERLWRTVSMLKRRRDYAFERMLLWKYRYHGLVDALEARGATREEIRAAVDAGDVRRRNVMKHWEQRT